MSMYAITAESFVDTKNSKCLSTSSETSQFKTYIDQCKTPSDTAVATTFLSGTIDKYKGLFSTRRAQYDDLIITGNNLAALNGSTGDMDSQINKLSKQKAELQHQIEVNRSESSAYDQTFLEDIYNGTPDKKLAPTLQDVSLLLFWFGWLVMSVVLIYVRTMSPGGTFQSGLFVFVLLLLVTLCVFAIISYAA